MRVQSQFCHLYSLGVYGVYVRSGNFHSDYLKGRNFRWKKLSLEETFTGRNFRVFADFCLFRESLLREIFQYLSFAKFHSRKIFKISKLRKKFLWVLSEADLSNQRIKGCHSLSSCSVKNLHYALFIERYLKNTDIK